MTNREWEALNEMVGIKVWVDGYDVVSVGVLYCSKSFLPMVRVEYHIRSNLKELTMRRDTILTAVDRDLLRATYDKYLSIKHELV